MLGTGKPIMPNGHARSTPSRTCYLPLSEGRGGVDVGAWLRDLGLGRYEPAFRANDVDGEDLRADEVVE